MVTECQEVVRLIAKETLFTPLETVKFKVRTLEDLIAS